MNILTSCGRSLIEDWCNVIDVDAKIEGVRLVEYWKSFVVDASIRM